MSLCKVGIRRVARGYDFRPTWPFNAECRVIPAYSTRRLRMIELRHLVEDFTIVFQRQKAVRAPFGNGEHKVISRGQNGRCPLLIGRRIRPQIERYVKNRASRASDYFCLCGGCSLIVHAAQCPLSKVAGNVALHKPGVQPTRSELLLAPGADKESPFVMDKLGADLENSRYLSFKKRHVVDVIVQAGREKRKTTTPGSSSTAIPFENRAPKISARSVFIPDSRGRAFPQPLRVR